MNDDGSSKRPLSTFSPPSSVKRAKSEHDNDKLARWTPLPIPLSAVQGVERIPLLDVHRCTSEYLDKLASERTETLRAQGRRVVGLPVVLSDGIVLNWVRHRLSSVGGVGSHKVDPVVCRNDTCWIGKQQNGKPRLVAGAESGTSAANAHIIDSDDDIGRISIPAHADKLRDPLSDHSNQAIINYLSSNIEPSSSIQSETQAQNDRAALRLAIAQQLFPEIMSGASSGLPASGALPEERRATTRLRSDLTYVTTSDFEIDESDEKLDGVEDINGSTISARHAKSPPLTSLQPIRELLARWKRRGDPERDKPPEGTVVVSEGSQKRERNEFLEEAPAITSSESDEESVRQTSDPQLKRVPLPKTDYGRARRLLMPESGELPLVAVTMRGDCHFIDRKKKFRITRYSLPNPGVFRHVGDACMVGNTAVIGCDKGTHQISLVSVAGKPQMIDVTLSPHCSGPRYQDDVQKRGVSRLTSIHAEGGYIKFLSGGYDGTIHEWTAGVEKPNEAISRKVVSLGTRIMALAYRGHDRSVVAAAQRRLHITDLNRLTTTKHLLSNNIQQIHVHPQAAYITLLEVQHLHRQVLLYDSRKGDFDGEPCLSFGHRKANRSGYARGSVHLAHFSKATEDGCVSLWDFRNSKGVVAERCFQQAEKVAHTIFAERDIATFGEGVVTFFEDYLAR